MITVSTIEVLVCLTVTVAAVLRAVWLNSKLKEANNLIRWYKDVLK